MEEPDNPESMKNNITEGEGRPFLLKGKEKQNKEEKKEKDKKKNRKREKKKGKPSQYIFSWFSNPICNCEK